MAHSAQVSNEFYQNRLEWNDFSIKVYEKEASVMRELTQLADGQSVVVKESFKYEPSDFQRAA
jgi:hypothetical protein